MVPTRRYASLLLVTASEDTAALFARLLPSERFAPEYSVCSAHEAAFVLGEAAFDVVAVDAATLPDEALSIAAAAQKSGVTNILLIAEDSHFEAAAAYAEENGFMALKSPVDPSLLRQSLGMMAAASARLHELEDKAEDLKTRLEETRLVDRAKLILIQRFKMTEKDAHRFIEKNAMDRCVKRRAIAESIIRTYQN